MGLLKRTSNQARACESCEAAVAHCSSCFTVLAQRDYLSLCSCWTTPPLLSSHSFEINATKDQSECSLKENYDCSWRGSIIKLSENTFTCSMGLLVLCLVIGGASCPWFFIFLRYTSVLSLVPSFILVMSSVLSSGLFWQKLKTGMFWRCEHRRQLHCGKQSLTKQQSLGLKN